MEIKRSKEEIEPVIDYAVYCVTTGGSHKPLNSYEEGIVAFADWLFGETDKTPFEE